MTELYKSNDYYLKCPNCNHIALWDCACWYVGPGPEGSHFRCCTCNKVDIEEKYLIKDKIELLS